MDSHSFWQVNRKIIKPTGIIGSSLWQPTSNWFFLLDHHVNASHHPLMKQHLVFDPMVSFFQSRFTADPWQNRLPRKNKLVTNLYLPVLLPTEDFLLFTNNSLEPSNNGCSYFDKLLQILPLSSTPPKNPMHFTIISAVFSFFYE